MRWVFKSFLKMNKGTGGLDQSLEEVRIARIGFQPKLLENVVRIIVTLLIPALKKGPIKWMLWDLRLD